MDFRGLAVLFLIVCLLAIARWDLASTEMHAFFVHPDWLLAGLGIFFLLCSFHDVQPRHDLLTLVAGFLGGTVIEIWGTRTGLWHYYTWERPPLWILPAWSMSALANERLLRLLLAALPGRWRERAIADEHGGTGWRIAFRLVFTALFVAFLWWSRPALTDPYTLTVTVFLVVAFSRPRFPMYALALLACGVALGVFLEIWGTTRHCWNYYDRRTPSPFPIFAHGIAAVTFWKLKELLRAVYARLDA